MSDMRARLWAALPAVLLAIVASTQIVLTRTTLLSPWKGGGFGMFSTLDGRPFRYARMFVSAAERSEELAVPPSLEELVAQAEMLPGDAQFDRLPAPSSHVSADMAGRSSRCGSRCGASSSRRAR
jgi:hypothetical protein